VKSDAEEGSKKTLTFTVSDTGIGIDPEFMPSMFEAFTQEDDSFTRAYGGSGLGLAVAKKSVELMGGTISAESEKGKGSVFTIVLPLEYVSDEGGQIELEDIDLAGRRVLVVEDIPENAEIIMDLLDLEDVESEHAENGQIALDMFSQASEGYYDAILMDLRMPIMDGLESSRRIRALDRPDAKTIPIIAVTANAFDSDVKATMEAGMNAHLAKPADSDLLYETLRQQIAKAEHQK
jgi:CheY-like chemotaxis protein